MEINLGEKKPRNWKRRLTGENRKQFLNCITGSLQNVFSQI